MLYSSLHNSEKLHKNKTTDSKTKRKLKQISSKFSARASFGSHCTHCSSIRSVAFFYHHMFNGIIFNLFQVHGHAINVRTPLHWRKKKPKNLGDVQKRLGGNSFGSRMHLQDANVLSEKSDFHHTLISNTLSEYFEFERRKKKHIVSLCKQYS